jgi:hypothetical protein
MIIFVRFYPALGPYGTGSPMPIRLAGHREIAAYTIGISDNHLGISVFNDPKGDLSGSRIPFDTQVEVACWTENRSGILSINVFYLLKTPPWDGKYAPANQFANGDPVGQGGITPIDPQVPHCPS